LSSRYKHAHKTHAVKDAGGHAPGATAGTGAPSGLSSEDELLLSGFARLSEQVPDAAARAAQLHASLELDAEWREGKKLPLLRARRRLVEQALRASR
jgi:hypothetical protein